MRGRAALRVLMTADTVGGVWNHALDLVRALAPHGVEVMLIAMGGQPSPAQRREADMLSNLTLVGSDLRLEWMPYPEADLEEANRLIRAAEHSFRPDVVHVNGFANAAAGLDVPVVVAAHSCVVSWWRACHGGLPPDDWKGYRERLAMGLAAADTLLAPTEAFLASFAALHEVPRRRVVIHNGIDTTRYAPGAKQPVALAAGRLWDRAKNCDALRAAAPLLTCEVRLAGGGPLDGLPPQLHPLGWLDGAALAREMALAAVFVAPARYEPFGLAILEAALSGCALVLGDIPTLRELWEGAAIFVGPDDVPRLAASINGLVGDPDLAAAAGAAARARGERYRAGVMAAAYLRVYRDAAARGARQKAAAA